MKKYFVITAMLVCASVQAMHLASETLDLTANTRRLTFLRIIDPIKIKAIILMCSELHHWPAALERFTLLESLDFSQQLLSELKFDFQKGSFQHLRELVLSYNLLSTLPSNINALVALRKLYVGNNKLNSLPEELTDLKLELLSLENNELRQLPQSLSKMSNSLTTLYIKGNQFSRGEKLRIQKALPTTSIDLEKLSDNSCNEGVVE